MKAVCFLFLAASLLPAQEVLFPEGVSEVRLPLVMLSHGNYPGLPCVEVRIGERTELFMVDTGFGMTAVDVRFADELGLEQRGSDLAIGMAQARKAPLFAAPEYRLGAAVLETRFTYGLDLRGFSTGRGRAIRGLLGGELFHRCVVTLDYRGGELVLRTSDEFTPPEDATELALAFALGQPEVWARLDDQRRYRFMLDTGAEPFLVMNAPFVKRHSLIDDPERFPSSRIRGIGGVRDASIGAFARLRLGSIDVANVPATLMHPGRGFSLGGDQRRAGIIGSGFFARTRVTFDYPNRQLFVEHRDGDFAQLRMGGIAMQPKDSGQIRIADMLKRPDRPELNLKIGDHIVAVNGERPPADGGELRAVLGKNERTLLTVERGGERHEVEWPRIEALPEVRFATPKK